MTSVQSQAEPPEAVRFGDRLGLGFSCLGMGLREEAARMFEQALCLRAADPVAMAHLALCLWQLGDVKECRTWARRAEMLMAGPLPAALRRAGRPRLRIVA